MSSVDGVGRRTARAAMWGFLATALGKAVTLIGLLLLARILAPREFGLLAFAMAYMTYAETVGDLGSGMALVYWPDRRDEAAQVTFIVNAAAGLFWCLLTIALAPLIAAFFKTPAGEPIVRALAFSFPIKFLGTAHDALAQKDLRFRARAVPECAFALVKAGTAIALALLGYGAWSLVWGHLAGLASSTILLWVVVSWRPSWTWPRDLFKPMLAYGRSLIGVNILYGISADADLAYVGRFLGVTALGVYQMAARITETGISLVLRVISRVLFPAFSQVRAAGQSMKRPFLFAMRAVSAVSFPTSIGLWALAGPIVLAALGARWVAVTPVLGLLALSIGVLTPSYAPDEALRASGHTKALLSLEALRSVLVLGSLAVAARYSTVTVAGTLVVVNGFMALLKIIAAARATETTTIEVVRSLAPATIAAAVMAVAVRAWVHVAGALPPWPLALSGTALGAAVYFAAMFAIDRELIRWALKAVRPRKAQAVATANGV